jgi:23S rRNA C2498 (ribose-2'-O)-methylase RlmM
MLNLPSAEVLRTPEAELLIPWNLPIHHAWPCEPRQASGFVEKAAQALAQKFGGQNPQTILVGALHSGPAHQYYRRLASNLRGRMLQLFPNLPASRHDAEAQDPSLPTLFCLVGREGLYAGVQSPRACGGFYPGGTKFIKQAASTSISRAGAKLAEALYHLRLFRPLPAEKSHWLELGASPGGMTSELLARGYQVTAVDRAPLDERLRRAEGLSFVRQDVAAFQLRPGAGFDALLCDLNGNAEESMRQVSRLASALRHGAPVIFTLKLPGIQALPEILAQSEAVIRMAAAAGLSLVSRKHLSYNRHEFTLFFERTGAGKG